MRKKIYIFLLACFVLFIGGLGVAYLIVQSVKSSLPQLVTVKDYEPLMVSQVFDRNGKKIGEFFNERRTVVPYEKIPKQVIQAFMAAEDDQFFEHSGINIQAIMRATLANLRAGRSVQGGSTITQQVAKTLMLTSEKTFTRKLKDILLAIEMEKNLKKEEILYLYLNQIYFGQSAYGIEQASLTYFKKSVKDLTLPEMAILAGLPQAPSRYSPVRNPKRAKERQIYVLRRMADVKFITKQEAEKAIETPVKVYIRENYVEYAPYFLETLRQILVAQLGEDLVLNKGLKIHTSLDLDKQLAAQEAATTGLKALDKRQGYRGPLKNIPEDQYASFLEETKKTLLSSVTPERTILPNGEFAEIVPATQSGNLPAYLKLNETIQGIVTAVDDDLGLVTVEVPDSKGFIDLTSMQWARKPNPALTSDADLLKKPSAALTKGDVILVKVTGETFKSDRLQAQQLAESKKKGAKPRNLPDGKKYLQLELDQEPRAEAALISFDHETQDVLAMVGGLNFEKSEFNRAIQAPRQTGSAFKALVYAAALDKNYTPSTPIMDAPLVFRETVKEEGQEEIRTWKPANHSKSFGGDITFRNALVRSLNVPTVKIMEDIGVPWASDYARRLGVFSPLNPDFTLALGSSSVTLYEMTKAFAHFARLGKRLSPLMIHKVLDKNGKQIMGAVSLDIRFEKELAEQEKYFAEKREKWLEAKAAEEAAAVPTDVTDNTKKKIKIEERIFFEDPNQLIRPQTAYVMTSILKGVVEDPNGTGGRARALGREVAGKTGSSNNYYDAWFIGYTPQISTGVWVGFDNEQTLGRGEVGGRSALPIWLEYMKAAHEKLPAVTFPVPQGIVFTDVDIQTGKPASTGAKNVLHQAYIEGSEPTAAAYREEEEKDFLKEDLAE